MILKLHQGLREDGLQVSISQLCTWFGVARRSVYYRPTKSAPRVNPAFAEPIKKMIEEQPSSVIELSRGSWASTKIPCSGYSS